MDRKSYNVGGTHVLGTPSSVDSLIGMREQRVVVGLSRSRAVGLSSCRAVELPSCCLRSALVTWTWKMPKKKKNFDMVI
jgi:hypothetical protein